ncbi:hypothetical protein [Streptomyces sp. NPDC087270]|uniref:hypothetical protein n=1 Tax=Streptomyces sp. NPDC087270 TaxID=3365774 RepID=UPI00380444F3
MRITATVVAAAIAAVRAYAPTVRCRAPRSLAARTPSGRSGGSATEPEFEPESPPGPASGTAPPSSSAPSRAGSTASARSGTASVSVSRAAMIRAAAASSLASTSAAAAGRSSPSPSWSRSALRWVGRSVSRAAASGSSGVRGRVRCPPAHAGTHRCQGASAWSYAAARSQPTGSLSRATSGHRCQARSYAYATDLRAWDASPVSRSTWRNRAPAACR